MNRWSSASVIAAVAAFLIGLLEFGLVGEGLAWATEDFLGLSPTAHRVTAVIVGILVLLFALYAARRAWILHAPEPETETEESKGEAS
ncbi:MAG: hypothetical protein ACE5ED_07760 [Rhodothalassiaceae bacterium]